MSAKPTNTAGLEAAAKLADHLRPFEHHAVGSLRIDMNEVRNVIAACDFAASAQAAIDGWVRWADERLQEAQAETLSAMKERDAAEARADRLADGITAAMLILTPEPGDKSLTEREKTARQLLAALQDQPK